MDRFKIMDMHEWRGVEVVEDATTVVSRDTLHLPVQIETLGLVVARQVLFLEVELTSGTARAVEHHCNNLQSKRQALTRAVNF